MTSSYLTPEQVEALLRPINPRRVAVLDGLSHLEAYDVRAHLNRIFGFGRWSEEVVELRELFALETTTKAGKPAVNVGYRATVRLTIKAPDGTVLATYTEAAIGDSTMPTFKRGACYDMAVKTAASQALKRCAANLGDQFGLSLYRNGSKDALVGRTLVGMPPPEETEEAPAEAVDADAPEVIPVPPPEHHEEPEHKPAGRPADPKAEAEQWMAANTPTEGQELSTPEDFVRAAQTATARAELNRIATLAVATLSAGDVNKVRQAVIARRTELNRQEVVEQ